MLTPNQLTNAVISRLSLLLTTLSLTLVSCASTQNTVNYDEQMEPLYESTAMEIMMPILAQRGYKAYADVELTLQSNSTFKADLRLVDNKVAIEFLDEQDMREVGIVPPPAPGSLLHVIPATIKGKPAADGSAGQDESVYLFILKAEDYKYHHNPAPDQRAGTTIREIERRLTKNLNDFLTWHEANNK